MQVATICMDHDTVIEKAQRISKSSCSDEIKVLYDQMFRDYCLIGLVAYQMKNEKDNTNHHKYVSRINDLTHYLTEKYVKIQEIHQKIHTTIAFRSIT